MDSAGNSPQVFRVQSVFIPLKAPGAALLALAAKAAHYAL